MRYCLRGTEAICFPEIMVVDLLGWVLLESLKLVLEDFLILVKLMMK